MEIEVLQNEIEKLKEIRKELNVSDRPEITKKINALKAKIYYRENKKLHNQRSVEWQKEHKERMDEIKHKASRNYRAKKMKENPEEYRRYLAQKQRESRARRKQQELENLVKHD